MGLVEGAQIGVRDRVRADFVPELQHFPHVVPGQVRHAFQVAVPLEGVIGADELRGQEEAGRQPVFGQRPRREQIVAIAIVKGDRDGARRRSFAAVQDAVDFRQGHDAEATLEHATNAPEPRRRYRQAVGGNVIGHAVKQQYRHEGTSRPARQSFLGGHGAGVLP